MSAITANFNGTYVPAGDYMWFSSMAQVSGVGSAPVTLHVTHQTIDFTVNGTTYDLNVPDSTIVLSPSTQTANTTFGTDGWSVSAPTSFNGNVFLSGMSWQTPSDLGTPPNLLSGLGGLLGGLLGQQPPPTVQNVTWSADFSTDTAGISVNWEWAASAYKNFTPNDAAIQVKTVDDSQVDTFQNSDHAGTPENFKSSLVAGARGNGGHNYTGSPTSTTTVQPEVIAAGTASITGNVQFSMFGGDSIGPVAGATVALTDASGNVVATTSTDSNGNYSFGSLAAGTYTVSVTDSSYDPQSNSVTLTDGQAATDNFTLS